MPILAHMRPTKPHTLQNIFKFISILFFQLGAQYFEASQAADITQIARYLEAGRDIGRNRDNGQDLQSTL